MTSAQVQRNIESEHLSGLIAYKGHRSKESIESTLKNANVMTEMFVQL